MPKKKLEDDPAEQSERFKAAVREMIDAGELDPTEADAILDKMVENLSQPSKG